MPQRACLMNRHHKPAPELPWLSQSGYATRLALRVHSGLLLQLRMIKTWRGKLEEQRYLRNKKHCTELGCTSAIWLGVMLYPQRYLCICNCTCSVFRDY